LNLGPPRQGPTERENVLTEAVPVVVVHGHDWLDYLVAFSTAAGLAIAGVALVVAYRSLRGAQSAEEAAKRSAAAAERTAQAAEKTATASSETAELAREELDMLKAEQARKPDLAIVSMDSEVWGEDDAGQTRVVALGVINEGDQDAEDVLLTFMAPAKSQIFRCDRTGMNAVEEGLLEAAEPFLPDEPSRDWVYATPHITLRVQRPTLMYFRVHFPSESDQPIKVKLSHPKSQVVASKDLRV
jgi:hypothetical protein